MTRLIHFAVPIAFIEALDSTIVITALPKIAQDYGVSAFSLSGIVASYVVAAALTIPLSGWVASKFGFRFGFSGATLVFLIGSLLSAIAPDPAFLVAARGIQGAGITLMVPLIQLFLLSSEGNKDPLKIVSTLTVPLQLGALVGPPLGGLICYYFDWRDIFYINSIFGAAIFFTSIFYAPNYPMPKARPLDTVGWILTAVPLAGLMYEATSVKDRAFGTTDALAVLACFVLLSLSLAWAKRAAHPILDLTLFRYRSFFVAHVGGTFFRIGATGTPFLLTIFFQQTLQLSVLASGFLLLVNAAGALFMKFFARGLVSEFGYGRVLFLNGIAAVASIAVWSALQSKSLLPLFCFTLFAGGFCRSLQYVAIQSLPFLEVTPQELPDASSLSNVIQKMGTALGITVAAQSVVSVQYLLERGPVDWSPVSITFGILAVFSAAAMPFFRSLHQRAPPSGHERG